MWDISLTKTVVIVAIVAGVFYTVWRQYQQSSRRKRAKVKAMYKVMSIVSSSHMRADVVDELAQKAKESPTAKIFILFNLPPSSARKAD